MTQHSDPSVTLTTPATADLADPLAVQRVRHALKGRHVQVVRRTQVSPGFVRLTLAGPDLADFVSAGFDDHVKLILPAPGQERASLPQLVDGRPQFTGPRPVLRDYTPAHWDAAQGSLDIEVALHDAGPASDWAAAVQVGQWAGIAGPRGSLVIPVGFDWHWLLGDETALPAIARRLAELPATARAVVRVQLRNPQDQRALASAAQLDVAWVDSLTDAAQALAVPAGPGYIWAAGEHSEMAALRGMLAAKPGVDAKRMRIAAYWKRGEADHHENLTA